MRRQPAAPAAGSGRTSAWSPPMRPNRRRRARGSVRACQHTIGAILPEPLVRVKGGSKGRELRMRASFLPVVAGLLASALATPSTPSTQAPPAPRDVNWPMFRHDAGGTGHSPLLQITPDNVAKLNRVWTYRLQSAAPA